MAQAASESFTATRTRPNGPRRRARMATENSANTTAKKMVKDLGELVLSPNNDGLAMATEPLKPKMADQGKKALSMALAKAMVARAR